MYCFYFFDTILFQFWKGFSELWVFELVKRQALSFVCSIVSWFHSSQSVLLYCPPASLWAVSHPTDSKWAQSTQHQLLHHRHGLRCLHSGSQKALTPAATNHLSLTLTNTHFLVMLSYPFGNLLWRCLTRGLQPSRRKQLGSETSFSSTWSRCGIVLGPIPFGCSKIISLCFNWRHLLAPR